MRSLISLLLLTSCAGSRSWSRVDYAAEFTSAGVQTIDWYQTNQITAACQEGNPAIGECGGRVPPAVYFPATIVLHALVSALLPHGTARSLWQGAGIGAMLTVEVLVSHRQGYLYPWESK